MGRGVILKDWPVILQIGDKYMIYPIHAKGKYRKKIVLLP
jgi:hypothetical protein